MTQCYKLNYIALHAASVKQSHPSKLKATYQSELVNAAMMCSPMRIGLRKKYAYSLRYQSEYILLLIVYILL